MNRYSLLIAFLFILGCGKTTTKKATELGPNVSAIYSSQQLLIKVYYETGAEPYISDVPQLKYWSILEKNLDALFVNRSSPPVIVVPKDLTEMVQIGQAQRTKWSVEQVLALSKEHQQEAVPGTSVFQVFFLNGNAQEGNSIIGFHISGTNVIAIFKDVIRSSGQSEAPLVSKYVEQATIVHELGHALGLVNNGLPMTESHQDTAHGHHCSHPECVMYYSNEGFSSMVNFARNAALKTSLVMFDLQCQNDAKNYK